jgi:hypothetical protein
MRRQVELEQENIALKLENTAIHEDLRLANQKLEIVGAHLSDRDDILATYRR